MVLWEEMGTLEICHDRAVPENLRITQWHILSFIDSWGESFYLNFVKAFPIFGAAHLLVTPCLAHLSALFSCAEPTPCAVVRVADLLNGVLLNSEEDMAVC
jgi:hypothetical protein